VRVLRQALLAYLPQSKIPTGAMREEAATASPALTILSFGGVGGPPSSAPP